MHWRTTLLNAWLCACLPAIFLTLPAGTARAANSDTAILAGGCFWTLQSVFDRLDGVITTTVGYSGGELRNPTYEQVVTGRTGHVEAVRIEFDPKRVTFSQVLEVYWRNIDPTRVDQQFCDIGSQYNAVIFVRNEQQRVAAEASRAALERSKPFRAAIRTPIRPAADFYPAEDEHQRYYENAALDYARYSARCGRSERLRQLWGR